MTMHAIFDEEGRIGQAGVNYSDPVKYESMLRDMGHKFVAVRTQRLISPDEWHVRDVLGEKRVRIRPVMPITVNKRFVRAGDRDSVVFKKIPKNATFIAVVGGLPYQQEVIPATELEYAIPVPCRAKVSFELWPYQTFSVEIEAVA